MSAPSLLLVGEFIEPAEILSAARAAYAAGYRRLDAFTPYQVEDLAAALGMQRTGVPPITLACALIGAATGYGMQLYSAAVDYPINVGGRPFHSWPAFVPITFELTILFAALGTVIGMLILNGLPRPHHPIFETPHFAERNEERFYLAIEGSDPRFDLAATREFLRNQHAAEIWELRA